MKVATLESHFFNFASTVVTKHPKECKEVRERIQKAMVQILKMIESVDNYLRYLFMNLNKIHWPISTYR